MKGFLKIAAAMAGLVCLRPLLAADSTEPGTTIRVPSGSLYFVRYGPSAGVPLIIVNGGPGLDHQSVSQSAAWADLARDFPVVLYDQRGTGQSVPSGSLSDVTVDGLVADLDQLRRHLRSDRLNLLGWSWGGYLVMAYVARHPEHVSHLILVGSGPPNLESNVYLFESVFPDIIARQKPNTTIAGKVGCEKERIEDYLRMEFYDPVKRDNFLARGRPFSFSEEACVAAMQDALKHDLTPQVRAFKVPTLVTAGRFDMNVAPVVSYKLSQTIPGAQFAIFERSGHMPFIEEPERFSQAVRGFLGNRPQARASDSSSRR